MEKTVVYSVIIMTLIIFSNCTEEESIDLKSYTIKFGTRCGWCAGQEYITVSQDSVLYERNIPCGDNQGNKYKEKESDPDQWDAITSSFDFEYFKSLEFDECNVCVDGCDEITIVPPE